MSGWWGEERERREWWVGSGEGGREVGEEEWWVRQSWRKYGAKRARLRGLGMCEGGLGRRFHLSKVSPGKSALVTTSVLSPSAANWSRSVRVRPRGASCPGRSSGSSALSAPLQ